MSKLEKICGTENPNRLGDVVFVHGLNGDARSTWQPDGQPERFWPNWIGEDLPDVGVWSVGYSANAFAWKGSTMPLADRAVNILVSLHTNEIGTKRPIVFITHSMGGLLVKEMLRKATDGSVPEGERLALNTRGVVFLSTPHSGSDLANFVNYLKVLLPSDSVRELQPNEPRLRELNTWYRNNVGKLGIETQVYRESRPTKVGQGWLRERFEAIVVDANSSDPSIPGVTAVPMDDDHITISRPERTSDCYKRIKKFVEASLRLSRNVKVSNDTAPSSWQGSNQEILKNVSARDIQPHDLPKFKQSILENANVGGNLNISSITQNINYLASPPPTAGIPQNLPRSGVVQFVGRRTKMDELHEKLQQNKRLAIIAVKGMGGIGKTELALQYCYHYHQQGTYAGGVCWLRAQEQDIGTQIVKFATAQLDLKPLEDLDLPTQLAYCWRRWREGDVLIVFDNVIKYQDIVPYLPPREQRFKVLLTTRKELGQSVQPFPLDVLNEPQALELLSSLVQDGRIEQQSDDAKALCEWLGYLPLGLELVGRYLARKLDLSLSEMRKRLSLDSKALRKTEEGMTAPLGVQAAIELSWQELDEEARELAYLLSLFAPAPVPWGLVQACFPGSDSEELGDIRDEQLVGLSLLKRTGEGIYQLHQLLREFFRHKLDSSKGANDLKRSYCRALVEEAQILEVPTREVVERVLPVIVIPHLVEVATTMLPWVEDENLRWPFVGLSRFYSSQGDYAQAQPWSEHCLAVCRERLGEEHLDVALSLNNLADLYKFQGKYNQAEPLSLQALELYKGLLGEEHLAVALSLNNLAYLYHAQGRYDQAEPLYLQALELNKRLLGEEHPNVALSLNNLAELYRNQGKYDQAEPLYLQALELYKGLLGEEHPSVALSLNNLALLYVSQGKYNQAEPLYTQALELNKRLLGEEHPSVALSLNNLALLYVSQGKYNQAEPLYTQALAILVKSLGPEHPNTAKVWQNYVTFLEKVVESQGKYDQAEPFYVKALELSKRLLGDEHPNVAASLNNLAYLYHAQGRYDQAEPLYLQALELNKRLLGEEHPNVASSLNNLAGLYDSQGKYDQAEPFYVKALELSKRLLGEEHPNVASILNNLAYLYSSQGRNEQAEPLYRRALEMRKRLLGEEHPSVANSLSNLAALYKAQGRNGQAEPLYVQALEMRKRLLGEEHPSVATSLNNLAGIYSSQGRNEQAEPLYVQALEMRKRLLGEEHPAVATSLNNLAGIYSSQGCYEQAEPLYVRVLEMRKRLLGEEHPDVATSLNNLAGIYSSQGRYSEAKILITQALEISQKILGKHHPLSVALQQNLEAVRGD
jgi:tetratricopeptide (TPR) repeat protein/pimeloyl-ACP methyl ester carboxylesterase